MNGEPDPTAPWEDFHSAGGDLPPASGLRERLALALSPDLAAVANQIDDALVDLVRFSRSIQAWGDDPRDRFYAAVGRLMSAWRALAGKDWDYPTAEVRRTNREAGR